MKTEKRCCVFKDNCLKIIFFLYFIVKEFIKKMTICVSITNIVWKEITIGSTAIINNYPPLSQAMRSIIVLVYTTQAK